MMDIILLRFSKLFSNQEHQDKSRGASFEAGVRGLRSPAGLPALPGSWGQAHGLNLVKLNAPAPASLHTGSKLAKVPLPLDSQTQARGSGSAKRAQAPEFDGGAGGLQPRRQHRILSSQWAPVSGGNVPGESIGQPSTVTSPSPGYSCGEDLVLV